MNNDHAAVAAAEAIVRDATEGDPEQLLDAVELPLRLAAEQLQQAARAAQDALLRLHEAAQAYGPLHAAAWRELASLGLGVGCWPGTALYENAAEADGAVVLRGTCYAGHSPEQALLRTLSYVLNEAGPPRPAGSRVELRIVRTVGEG